MISLPGLALTTRRYEVAASILRTFARYVDQGMLPNRFPELGEAPEYNTADATLWYFEAIKAYLDATQDMALLRDLMPVLRSIIDAHIEGTRYQIHMDSDGLLYAGEAGVQLTWMDVKVGDWVVTPRTGKAVEINALWYNALNCMIFFEKALRRSTKRYEQLAVRLAQSYARFWNEAIGCCYDVIDGPEGDDPAVRPNQVIAGSLQPSDAQSEKGGGRCVRQAAADLARAALPVTQISALRGPLRRPVPGAGSSLPPGHGVDVANWAFRRSAFAHLSRSQNRLFLLTPAARSYAGTQPQHHGRDFRRRCAARPTRRVRAGVERRRGAASIEPHRQGGERAGSG